MKECVLWKDVYMKDRLNREDIKPDDLCSFGVSFLDDALCKIAQDDLIVIGADSGAGKSELALLIAQHNAAQGKKVAVYFLEGGEEEAMRRMKWRDICRIYYDNFSHAGIEMDYRKWTFNMIDHEIIKRIETEILWNEYSAKYKENLFFYPAGDGCTLDELNSSLLDFHKLNFENKASDSLKSIDLDLIVIDHIQYFSLINPENELAEVTEITKQVKRITNKEKIPVILVSHLRKKTRDRGIPDQEDLFGTSNISKIASVVINICPSWSHEQSITGVYPTWVRISKCRTGIRSNIGILAQYNSRMAKYEDNYVLYKIFPTGAPDTSPLTPEQIPKWAQVKEEKVR